MRKVVLVLLVALMVSTGAWAQTIASSTLTGKVTADGGPLPGVMVTATSERLQGPRATVTDSRGNYHIPLLPPGDYTVKYEMTGMQTREETLTLTAVMTDTLNVDLKLAAVEGEIIVTADKNMTAPIEATAVSLNINQDLINDLPINRDMEAITLLAPGVNAGGPGGNTVISGAMSYDSLYLINGVIVNENLRGQPQDLYIEDAIEETTVFTGGISAEFGHFTGGVVNMLTKSGGNQFQGSFRTTLRNESWTEPTALTAEQEDKINPTYEATLGGPIVRDKLWFFTAGRYTDTQAISQTEMGLARSGDQYADGTPYVVGDPIEQVIYPYETDETRLEAKLTWAITNSHRVIGSYADVDATQTNYRRSGSMDLRSLNPNRLLPNTLMAFNYSGVITENFFIEAQVSKKEYSFLNSGSSWYDLINGTLVLDRARGTRYWSPTFRIKPGGEQRDHELAALNGTYFLSTESFGTHELKAGYQYFNEIRDVNNYQNGSDYRVSLYQTIIRGDQIFPRVRTGSNTRIYWYPIFVPSEGSNYASDSIYINDRWVASPRLTFNLGLRYDKNDAVSGDGSYKVADDSAVSPRLGANWDVFGNGKLTVAANYGQYVGRLAEGVGNDGDPAGRTASFNWSYGGPAINDNVNTPTDQLIGTAEALEIIFDWFFANGGTDIRPLRSNPSIPGFNDILDPNGSLKSPSVDEWTIGVGAALGQKGVIRADLVFRQWNDFYTSYQNMDTGQVEFEGRSYDLAIVTNDIDTYNRDYKGLHTQAHYRFDGHFSAGLSYTLSYLEGNVTGEDSSSGPVRGTANEYPEYREAGWNYPTGYLTGDRRHRAKLWGTYDLSTKIGGFNFSLMQTFESGTATSTDGAIDVRSFVDNPGYVSPPSTVSYYFYGRGDLKSDDITRTDIGIQYTLPLKKLDIYLRGDVFNIFNEQGVESFDEEVLTEDDEDWLILFNPFTETPIECPQGAAPEVCEDMGAHWQKGPNFGEPTIESDYQRPRTFRFTIGLRF